MKPVRISLQNKVNIEDIFPIIIPVEQKDVQFKITNYDKLKEYKIVLSITKNKRNFTKNIKYDTFNIKVEDLKKSKIVIYLSNNKERKTLSFNRDEFNISNIMNLSNSEKFEVTLRRILEEYIDLKSKVEEIEDEIYDNVII